MLDEEDSEHIKILKSILEKEPEKLHPTTLAKWKELGPLKILNGGAIYENLVICDLLAKRLLNFLNFFRREKSKLYITMITVSARAEIMLIRLVGKNLGMRHPTVFQVIVTLRSIEQKKTKFFFFCQFLEI